MRHPRRWLSATLIAIAACSNQPSRLDGVGAAGGDPWASSGGSPAGKTPEGGGGSDGLGDLQRMLGTIAESIEKPGPYEAPERSATFDAAAPHWGVLGIGGGVVERRGYSLTGGGGTELAKLIVRLRGLAKQEQLTGVILRVEPLGISLPDAIELRAAMHELRAAGKKLACHVEDASNATYLVLAACERIGIAPLGQIALTGPAAMPIHVKPLLDKLGVQADFLHVGAYKGAAEPLTRDAPSKEMTETLGAILDRRYATMVDVVATERKLAPDAVKGLIDTALFSSDQARTDKLVDAVAAFEAFRDETTAGAAWTKLELGESLTKDKLAAGLQLLRFLGAVPTPAPAGDHVALVYAVGSIIDGDGGGLLGARQEIAAHTLVAALRKLAADERVKAVVLRIDSGGGSAQASELIWGEVTALRKVKPIVVSMSDVAASGGYYIAVGANKIFAHPETLTGSIGVVGGKLAPGAALAQLGINAFPMGRGKRALILSGLAPWTPDERGAIQRSMEDVYRTFVARVAAGRGKTPAEIEPLAQGRVWTGARAKELGLVDELGGLDAALAAARDLAKLPSGGDVEIYPPPPTLRDFLNGLGGMADLPFVEASALAAIGAVNPALAGAARELVELALSFRTTHVQAVAVVPVIR